MDEFTPISTTLLGEIKTIGTATYSNLHTLRLDSLVSAGESVLVTSSWVGCQTLMIASFKKLVSAGFSLLAHCTFLITVYLPLLASVGYSLLQGCTSLTTISLPLLTSAEESLLHNCTSLTSADLSSLVSAGSCLLFGCTALISLTINNNIKAENVNSIGQLIIGDITDGITPSGFIGNPVSPDAYTAVPLGCIVHRSGMADTTMETLLAEMCKDVTNANGSITSLTGDNVGKWVKSYTDGAGSIISVDDSAFSYNPLLAEVNFPSATNIDAFAFSCCASLETAIFPSVTYISGWAFQYCTSLEALTLGGASITLGVNPFNGVDTTVIALSLSVTESATVDRTGALPKWKNLSWKSVYTAV
ncbi:MAG: leucine-rich repeat domain-containing protein [Holosporales bacterium]|jgi:hypothetical protein|nr:leucine-rich repeat domain-containing protein [Holosporales bacterium]